MMLVINGTQIKVSGEESAVNDGLGFTYYNQLPDNQISEGNYFDLLVKPGHKQTLVTEFRNEKKEEMTIQIRINDAKTAENGVIEYGMSSLESTTGNRYKLTDYLTGPDKVSLKAGEIKQVAFELTMPDTSFKGVILGGIQLAAITEGKESKSRVSIRNEFSYAFSISLRQTEALVPYQISFGEAHFNSEDKRVRLKMNNDSQEIIKNMTVSTIITAVDSDKVLIEAVTKNKKMAPMSVMTYPVSFPKAKLGRYKMVTKVSVEAEEWETEQEFDVLATEEYEKNREEIDISDSSNKKLRLGVFIVLGVTLLVGTVILFSVLRLSKQ